MQGLFYSSSRWVTFFFLFFVLNTAFSMNVQSSVPKTLESGTLTIGTYFTNPPFEFLSDHHQIGLEVDLIKEIAARLHLTTKFIPANWKSIINDLNKNRYDVIMGAIVLTPESNSMISFSKPYMTTTLGVLINTKRMPALTKVSDLQNQIVGVQADTADYDMAIKMQKKGLIKSIKVYPFETFNFAINDLLANKIGAVIKIFPVEYYYVKQHPELKILARVPNDPQSLRFGFNKNNTALLAAVDKIQFEMQSDGTYQKILRKWFSK